MPFNEQYNTALQTKISSRINFLQRPKCELLFFNYRLIEWREIVAIMASLGLAKEVHKITVLSLVLYAVHCKTAEESCPGCANVENCNRVPVPASAVLKYHDGTGCDGTLAPSYVFVCIISNLITIMRNHHYPHLAEIPSVRENMRANTEQRSKKRCRSSSDFLLSLSRR